MFVLAEGSARALNSGVLTKDHNDVEKIFPDLPDIPSNLPDTAHRFLKQALESLYAPDGAAMLAGSAVDAMLKEKGLEKGSVYERIERAVENNVLTRDMAEWAHEVRLGSNRPCHADKERPHVSTEEAKQAVEFAHALGQFLFELPARIQHGKEAAMAASENEEAM